MLLSEPTSVQPTFVAPNVAEKANSLRFLLTVAHSGGLMATDSCVVDVPCWVNSPPTAEPGPDQEVKQGDTVTLDGYGSLTQTMT
jgi:hypothetical protein